MVSCKNSSPQNYKYFTHPYVILKSYVIYDEIYDVSMTYVKSKGLHPF